VSSESRGERNLVKGGVWQILVSKRREEWGGPACRSNGGRKGGWTRWSPGPKGGGGGQPGSGSHGRLLTVWGRGQHMEVGGGPVWGNGSCPGQEREENGPDPRRNLNLKFVVNDLK
jgi:hypothetical protein